MDDRLHWQSERLGGGIRALRRSRGLTLVALAELSGLSHPFLSQVERGLARPSMVSLEKIARALGSSQLELMAVGPDLLRGAPVDRPAFVASHDGERGPYGLGQARLLVRGTSSFHPMEFVGSNTLAGDFHRHGEDEFLYCLSGEVTVDLDCDGIYRLVPGDSLYFPGGTAHRWYTESGGEYRLLLVKQHLETADAAPGESLAPGVGASTGVGAITDVGVDVGMLDVRASGAVVLTAGAS